MVILLNIATAVFAFGAAMLWWRSASIKLPMVRGTWDGLDNLEKVHSVLTGSARINRYAAICAGLAALAQALSVVLSLTRGTCR